MSLIPQSAHEESCRSFSSNDSDVASLGSDKKHLAGGKPRQSIDGRELVPAGWAAQSLNFLAASIG